MRCAQCNATLPEAARFCIACGTPAPVACPACRFANIANANYCARCGTRLAHSSAEPVAAGESSDRPWFAGETGQSAERRQLTVMFCDLVESTALASRLDPEALREVIASCHRCIADAVERFGGFVARYMGDGALVYFGYPNAYDDNAERAVRAGLAVVAGTSALRATAEPLQTRVGIATGLVVVGELVTAGAANEQTALGQTPNLAARLQVAAAPDSVLIDDNTHRRVGERFECVQRGPLELKGFSEPVLAWQVLGERPDQRPFRTRPAHAVAQSEAGERAAGGLIGREHELAMLRNAWSQAREGSGRAVLVVGDAGIGKTRLVQALTACLQGERYAQLEFRCSGYHANSPLHPVIALLPDVIGWRRDDPDDRRLAKLDAFCTRHGLPTPEALPLLASLLSLEPAERFPPPAMSPERQKQQTLKALADILFSFAREQPLLVVAEDLHWMDPTTMELLSLTLEQVTALPLLVLVTARPHFEPAWRRGQHIDTLTLTRMSRAQTEVVIDGIAAGKRLPAEVVTQILAKTDGVPLFAEELTKMILESGLVQLDDDRYRLSGPLPPLAIPSTLQDSLAARIDQLGRIKPVVQLCATLGREFSYALLRAVSTVDDAALREALDRLVDAQFLSTLGEPPDVQYRFTHALIQEAAYESLLRSTRRQCHERIARAIVERFAPDAEAQPEVVAMHYTEAADGDAAVSWWQKAGHRALHRASYAEAIAHYRRGLAVLQTLPPSHARDQAELGVQVDLGYALIPVRGWAGTETAQAFTRAGALCHAIGDTPASFRALWGLGAFHFVRGDQNQARRVAGQCLAMTRDGGDLDARIEAQYLGGIVGCAMGEFVAAQSQLEASIRLYGPGVRDRHRLLYGQDPKASALGWLAMNTWVLGHPDEALQRADEAHAFVRDARQPFMLARALAGIGFVHVFRREPERAEAPLAAALALCVEQGFTYFHAVVSAFRGTNLVYAGRSEEAVGLMQESIGRLRRIGSEVLFSLILGHFAVAQAAVGHVDEALAAVDQGLKHVADTGERWGASELYRLRGELLHQSGGAAEEARSWIEKALEVARQQHARSYELRAATSLARLASRQATTASKDLLARTLASWSRELDTPDLRDARALLDRLSQMDAAEG